MKLRRNKKGFTIIELVIVIAVIGILAAVLIPTFVNLTNKANEAADNALVNNLNKALKMEEQEAGHQKAPTLEGAIKDLEDQGYILENLASKSGKDLLWSQSENQFLLNTEGKSGKDYWKIVDAVPAQDDQKYSYYAGKNFNQTDVTVKYGFDAGRIDNIGKVTYVGTGAAQEVAIRTNSFATTVTIDAANDTVNHYDEVGKVDAQRIDLNHCYNEYGTAAYIKVTEGKVVAKDGGEIAVVFANNTDSSKVAVAKDSNGTIKKGLTTVEVVDTNNYANYAVHLEYSVDGINPYTAETIEAIGELSVASETGVQPQGMNYIAVVNLVGYNSLQEAINAASSGDVVSLLKDYSTSDETLVISKDITLKGNNHSIENRRAKTASTYNDNKSGRDAAIYVNSNVTFEDLNLTTTKLCLIHVQSSCTNKTINLNNCVMSAPTNSYGFFVANGADKLNININNTTLRGWCAAYLKCSNSTINVNDSVLTGVNGATQAPSNGFGTFVIDGNMSSGDTTYGSNNNVKISNTDIYANTDTEAGANVEIWLLIQYRAHNNTVVVTGGNIYSTNPIAPEKGWEYHHFSSGSDEDVQSTNTVTVNGVQYYGFPSNHD